MYFVVFQLTRLMRGVTRLVIFIILPPPFQLTRLMRGVTLLRERLCNRVFQFQLTRLMRGVTIAQLCRHLRQKISTHTPHARRDR